MIRHPPPVKKPTEQNRTGENGTVNVKAEINITHDSEESKHHHKKVIGRTNGRQTDPAMNLRTKKKLKSY